MNLDRVRLRALIALQPGEYDEEGDEWLFRPNPDEASLDVDRLTDAILDLIPHLALK